MANSLDATVTLAPHSAQLDKANGRRCLCLREKSRTRRDSNHSLRIGLNHGELTFTTGASQPPSRSREPPRRRNSRWNGCAIVFLIVVAPIANTARLCARNPYHDIGLLVMFFGMTLLGVGLFLVVVGGAAVFGVRL